MRTEVAHFTVEGDFVTQLAREARCDGDAPRALKLLGHVQGLPEDAKHAILAGTQKLAGTTEGPGIYLAADDAKTDKRGRKLLTMVEYLDAQAAKEAKAKRDAEDRIIARSTSTRIMGSPWGRLDIPWALTTSSKVSGKPVLAMSGWEEFEERFPELVNKAKRRAEKDAEAKERSEELGRRVEKMGERAFSPYAGVIANMDPRLQAAAEAVLNPPKVCPAPDKDLTSMNGWINPEGKLYPCGFMGHDNLAHLLGKTVPILEKSWVKLQDRKDHRAPTDRPGDHDFQHIPDRGVTQAQFNTMARWCTKHSRPVPTNIEVR